MRNAERLFLYPVAIVALILGLASMHADPSARAHLDDAEVEIKIATCDIFEVVERLMESDRYAPAREEAMAAAEDRMRPYQQRLEEAQRRAQSTPQEDPLFRDIFREFQRAQQEYQQRGQELMREQEMLTTRQILECYRLVRSSAEAVAEQIGYTMVLQTRQKKDDNEAQDMQSAVRAMLARPVAVAPEAIDITADVLFELRLD